MTGKTQRFMIFILFLCSAAMLQGCQSARDLFPSALVGSYGDLPSLPPAVQDPLPSMRSSIQIENGELQTAVRPATSLADDAGLTGNPSYLLADSLVNALDNTEVLKAEGKTAEHLTISVDKAGGARDATRTALETYSAQAIPAAMPSPEGIANDEFNTMVNASLPEADRLQLQPLQKTTPTLIVSGVRPGKGHVRVAIFSNGDAFPQPSGASQVFSVQSESATLELPLQMEPPFAVAVYQDINGDGELSRNRLGVPSEPFAFSNNAMGRKGPPSFDDAKVERMSTAATKFIIPISLP